MHATITRERAVREASGATYVPPPATAYELEKRTSEAAQRILSSGMNNEEKQDALSELMQERATLLTHVPFNGIKGTVFFTNIQQIGLPPTPACPAYNKMRVPTISTYHEIGSNIAVVSLDPSAIHHVPKSILEKLGDLSDKEVQLFWTAIDAKGWINAEDGSFKLPARNGLFNLVTHPWAHPYALYDKHNLQFRDNICSDVDMGIFPELGVEQDNALGAVTFHRLSPMAVYTHDERFSPDNAHFHVIPGSPLAVFWVVTRKDNRIAITKMCVLFQPTHPICKPIYASINKNCTSLAMHLDRLAAVKEGVENTFAPLIALFENRDPKAMEAFNALTPAFKQGIYYQTWLHFGSPCGIHHNFGSAAFHSSSEIDRQFHCNDERNAQIIREYANRLEHLLYESQVDLTLRSQPLVKADNVLKLMECAHLFKQNQVKEAEQLLEQFPQKELKAIKEAIYFATWENHKCPRGNPNFGVEHFERGYWKDRAEALFLAASRVKPQFAQQQLDQEEPIAPAAVQLDDDLIEKGKEKEETPDIENPVPIAEEKELPTEELIAPAAVVIDTNESVLNALMAIAYDQNSPTLDKADKAKREEQVTELLSKLDQGIRNTIYGKVFEYSVDPKKGGPSWGEKHVADDMNALMMAILDILST